MAVPRAAGHQDQKASGYIPEVYSKKWAFNFYAQTVASSITNTRFEGEIAKMGDKVIIPTTPEIMWANYHRGQKLETTGKLESDPIVMEVNRAHYFKFIDDDIDKKQRGVDAVSAALDNSAKQGAIRIDRQLLCDMPNHAAECNQGKNAGVISKGFDFGTTEEPISLHCGGTECSNDAINLMLDMMTALEEQDVVNGMNSPDPEGLYYVIPPLMKNLILKHRRFSDASAMGDSQSALRNGRIGKLDNAVVLCSNNLKTYEIDNGEGGKKRVFEILAGHKMATTFVSQLTKEDNKMRSEQTFGDLYRKLQVYDWKVTNPEGLVVARISNQ